MPHLMNCPHKCGSHCLACVKEEWERTDAIINQQAETIEVLREWIRKCGKMLIEQEREIIDNPEFSTPEDLEEANSRITALEGM